MQVASPQQAKHPNPFKGFMPFFWLALVCVPGVCMAEVLHLSIWFWAVAFSLSMMLWMLAVFLPKSLKITHILRQWLRYNQRLPGVLLAAVFFISGWRYMASQPLVTPAHAAYYNERGTVQMLVTVVEPPEPHDMHTKLIVAVNSLKLMDGEVLQVVSDRVEGKVLLLVQPWQEFSYGDRLMVTGELQTPFEMADFSYKDYLARKGILSTMSYAQVKWIDSGGGNPIRGAIYTLQSKGYVTLQEIFPAPESDLLAGILLGNEQGLSAELQEAFRKTGTTHIIAISGFNIAILAGLFSGIFTRILGRKWGTVSALMAIAGYTVLVGGNAAVVRAAIMGGLGIMGGMFGRRQNGLNSIGLAAIAMILIDPNVLWDIGFQLSIAATMGLVLYAQPLEERFVQLAKKKLTEAQAQKLVAPASEFFLFTFAAQIMTLPIIAYHFRDISWLAFFASPLILPPQPLVMILGGLAMLIGMLLPGLGQIAAIIALPFVRYTIQMVTLLANFPGGELTLPDFHWFWLVFFYGLLFFFTLLPESQQEKICQSVFSHSVGLLLIACVVFFVWNRVLVVPDDRLHLTLLDAEGTLLIQTPGGDAVLIGGGSSPSHLKQVLGQLLPKGGHRLAVVIVGSAATDDLMALTAGVKTIPESIVLWGVNPTVNQTSAAVYSRFTEEGIPVIQLASGQVVDLGDEIFLKTLWVGDRGSVLWLEWRDFTTLIPAGKVDDHWLNVPAPPKVILLKDGLTPEIFPLDQVNAWSPCVILLPLEVGGLPLSGQHALVTLLEGYPVVSNLGHLWVRATTDGSQIWVYGE